MQGALVQPAEAGGSCTSKDTLAQEVMGPARHSDSDPGLGRRLVYTQVDSDSNMLDLVLR
jgi:hypothetical protein